MFRSLTSFIFGSNTSETTNRDQEQQQENREQQQQDEVKQQEGDAENTIEVTSSTPSVTGAVAANTQRKRNSSKRGKNRRNTSNNSSNNSSNNKRKGQQQQKPPSITKLLTPNDEADEDLDDWFIVDKEDEDESLPRTDSEEELSIVEVKQSQPTPAPAVAAAIAAAQRRRQHFNSHSLYGGPRPQQQRNYLQRTRNNAGTRSAGPLSVSTLSPPRSVAGSAAGGANAAPADGGVTQSLYVANCGGGAAGSSGGPTAAMDESWFVTPPPCFTSIGPINMETSPFENLLIEHPSMSVYSSIRSAKEATESFVNLDLGVVEESQNRALTEKQLKLQKQQAAAAAKAVQRRATAVRLDSSAVAQMKQELLARTCQKNHDKHDRRQTLCRGAIARANKTRDFQSKSNRQRRSDQQHCKLVSGANNNRKTACY